MDSPKSFPSHDRPRTSMESTNTTGNRFNLWEGEVMNEAIIIWLYLSLGKAFGAVHVYLFLLAVAAGVFMLFVSINVSDCREYEEKEKARKFRNDSFSLIKKYSFYKLAIFLAVASVFYPSKDDLKYIIGGAVAWNGIEAAKDIKGVEKLPENIVNAMNHFLEKTQEKK